MKRNTKNEKVRIPPFTVQNVVTVLSETVDWGLRQLKVPETWKITEGEDITILVIDTGMPDHNDLADGLDKEKCRNYVRGEDLKDYNGHSTHCCGIAGARKNDMGVVGVAPKCKLITYKVLGTDGSGTKESIVAALKEASILKPDIVSMSLGYGVNDPDIHREVKKLYEMDIPLICAAGNDGRNNAVNYPGRYEECIAVTAFDKNGNPASFNSTGPEVDISAPGVAIYSTYLKNTYAILNGTSMATPFISGIVALLISKHRKAEKETGFNDCKTVEDIKNHLKKYSDPKGVIGRDSTWGYGMINPERLLLETENTTQPVTPPPQTKKPSLWQRIKTFLSNVF